MNITYGYIVSYAFCYYSANILKSFYSFKVAFKDWINSQLKDDPDCQQYIPIQTSNLLDKLKDGIIFW